MRRHMEPDRPSGIKGEVRTKLCQARQARPTHTAVQGPEPRSHEVHFLACRSFAHLIAVRYYAIDTVPFRYTRADTPCSAHSWFDTNKVVNNNNDNNVGLDPLGARSQC